MSENSSTGSIASAGTGTPDPALLEARVTALSSLVKAMLTTLMLRGLVTRAEIAPLIAEAEALIDAAGPAAKAELRTIEADLPAHLRQAMGPPPDDDDHDH
jgi:hypothetical protein